MNRRRWLLLLLIPACAAAGFALYLVLRRLGWDWPYAVLAGAVAFWLATLALPMKRR